MKNNIKPKSSIKHGFFPYTLIFLGLLCVSCKSKDPITLTSNSEIQILTLGDSRVEGGRPTFESYRYELWKNLVTAGIQDFDFIGSIEDDGTFEDFKGLPFDLDHEGTGGATTDYTLEIAQRLAKGGNVGDIVLLGIGGNDLVDEVNTVSQTLENINKIIDVLQSVNENVIIFLEQIAPSRSDFMTPELAAKIDEFNEGILVVAKNQNEPVEGWTQPITTSRVIPVTMGTDWKDEYMADEVHYNEAGGKVIADRYFTAMKRFFGSHGWGYFFGGQETSYSKNGAMIYSSAHDPTHIVKMEDYLVLFGSAVRWSTYKLGSEKWELKGDNMYISGQPKWYTKKSLWAPSIFEHQPGAFRIYHSSVIDEEIHNSRIGFADLYGSPEKGFTFTPAADYLLESENMQQPFGIDPALFIDKEGKHWLVYGSHAKGIYITELDDVTGLLKTNPKDKIWSPDDKRFTNIANYGGGLDENNIEAAYVYNHPDNEYYYLFVNWDVCCSGLDSSYNIKVGRSTSPTGPYLDQDGNDLVDGNGTIFLDANGEILEDDRFVGPGHAGIYRHTDGSFYFSHHFYDRTKLGKPSTAIWNLNWEEGWPVIETHTRVKL
jgi:lysophospholipase L1-like esterase